MVKARVRWKSAIYFFYLCDRGEKRRLCWIDCHKRMSCLNQYRKHDVLDWRHRFIITGTERWSRPNPASSLVLLETDPSSCFPEFKTWESSEKLVYILSLQVLKIATLTNSQSDIMKIYHPLNGFSPRQTEKKTQQHLTLLAFNIMSSISRSVISGGTCFKSIRDIRDYSINVSK